MPVAEQTLNRFSKHTAAFLHSTNIGVVECKDGLYVIDSGAGDYDGENLAVTLEKIFPQKKVLALINTHAHADHAGGNRAFLSRTKAELWTSRKEAFLMEYPEMMSDMYWGARAFEEIDGGKFRAEQSLKADRIICEEEIRIDDEVTLSFVPLPGHFFEQYGVIVKEEEGNFFFTADSLFGIELLRKTWLPFLMEPVQFRKTLDKIAETDAKLFIPSHGKPIAKEKIHSSSEVNAIVTLEAETLILKILSSACSQEKLLKAILDFANLDVKLDRYIWIGTTIRSYLSSMERRGLI